MLKKIGSIVLILVFCLQTIVGSGFMVYGNNDGTPLDTISKSSIIIPTGDNIMVLEYNINPSNKKEPFYKDDTFTLESIKLLNNSEVDINIKEVFVEQNASFFLPSGNISIKESSKKKIGAGKSETIQFSSPENTEIRYNGKDSNLPIVIVYEYQEEVITKVPDPTPEDPDNMKETIEKIEKTGRLRTNLNINTGGERPERPERPEPEPGTPALQVSTGRMQEGQPGDKVTVRLSIDNVGSARATNISVTPILEGSNFEIAEGTITKNIDRIAVNGSSSVSYSFQISDKAKMGTHPIKFSIKYANAENPSAGSQTEEGVAYVRVTSQNSSARLQVTDASFSPQQVDAGGEVGLGISIRNLGGFTAQQIRISLEGLGGESFTLIDGVASQYIKDLEGNKGAYISYRLKASEKIKGGSHPLTFKISYQEEGGEPRIEEHQIFIPVNEGEKKESLLAIENVEYPQDAIRVGQDFTFGFDLVNKGTAEARNIKVTAGQMGGDQMILPKSTSIRIVPELEGESSQRFNFIMTPSREAATQNYPIEITVTYQDEEVVDGKRETHTVNQYVGVYVVNPKKDAEEEETSKTVPKIIIDEYTLEPGIVKAGENFKLTTTFLNTSSQKSVQNVKISLIVVETSEKTGTVFTPVQSSNTFYIDHIAPKQKATKEIMLYTIPDAQAKTYTITVKFNYEDEKGEVFSEEDLIGIPVVQPSRIELGQIQFQGEAMEGQPLGVYVELYNTGKVMLNNLMIRMESEDFDITDSNLFVGNFQQGATEYYDRAMIIPRQPGKATGKLILTYEDPTGEELIKEEEFSIEVMEMFIPPMDEEWDMPMEEPKASLVKRIFTNKYLWMGLILAGFITAGLIVRKRRKVQEGLDLDE